MKYMHGERVKAQIIDTGIAIWREQGAGAMTARAIGKRLGGMSHAGVLYHFDNVADLKRQITLEAVARADDKIIPQLVLSNDAAVAHFDQAARQAWLASAA